MALTILFYLALLVFSQANSLKPHATCDYCDYRISERNLKQDDTLLGMSYKVVIQNKQHHYACTGAILNETHVITTATCIFPCGTTYRPEELSIADSITEPTFKHNVVQIIIHENFTYHPILTNDIALLKVTPSITPSDTVKFAKLPQANDVEDCDITRLFGWRTPLRGIDVTSFGISSYRIFNQTCCRKYYKFGSLNLDVLDTYLCAYSLDRDLFYFDSNRNIYHAGGLLTINGTLIGLLSGYRGENRNLLVMFVRVASYLTWINQ
ncbi:trypsin-like [Pseudomyrmex gracilis]|uniref:trypsin-like n=1 Tax=Pseudomyrmex gracilis TaxID=219809 RepID=UPI00099490BC|nr:trypsin-like [Pseudomyrmex gracilis]XP_020296366.1 trypsin-like [Pseudomyrmex gracilis]XP_020296372.1 trypsin-like [Pseudomyrmex gracilis]